MSLLVIVRSLIYFFWDLQHGPSRYDCFSLFFFFFLQLNPYLDFMSSDVILDKYGTTSQSQSTIREVIHVPFKKLLYLSSFQS